MTRLTMALLAMLVTFDAWAQPLWIQDGEYVIGENDALGREDVLNRPSKYIWQQFLEEHGEGGTHDLAAMGAVSLSEYLAHSHSLSALGAASEADLTTVETQVNAWHEASGLHKNPLRLGNGYLKEISGVLKWSTDDAVYSSIGGGSSRFGLQTESTLETALTYTGDIGFFSRDFQLAIFLEHRSLLAQSYFRVENVGYACTRVDFGVDASQHLTFTYTYDLANCYTATITSTYTLDITDDYNRMMELAVRVDSTGGNITFYRDGEAENHVIGTAVDDFLWGNDVITIGGGFKGVTGAVRYGRDRLSWPLTGWKTIDYGVESFPGAALVLPLNEGQGFTGVTDIIGGRSFTLGAGVDWVNVNP